MATQLRTQNIQRCRLHVAQPVLDTEDRVVLRVDGRKIARHRTGAAHQPTQLLCIQTLERFHHLHGTLIALVGHDRPILPAQAHGKHIASALVIRIEAHHHLARFLVQGPDLQHLVHRLEVIAC